MNLSNKDVALFFRLMWQVQFYVNRRLNILPEVDSVEAYGKLSSQQKIQVRDALFKNIDLLDDFVAENPAGLAEDELQLVQSWKRFVAGDFMIVRFLKRHAVFVSSDKSSKVYAVLGLYDSIEAVLHGRPLPIWVGAVLLPFKGCIIYDGLFTSRNILFGAGIRGDLNETYQTAKQNGTIIESLEPGAKSAGKPKVKKPARDWGPILDGLVQATEQLKPTDDIVQTRSFSVLKASARLAQAAAQSPGDVSEIARQAKSVQRALRQLETALGRAGRYD